MYGWKEWEVGKSLGKYLYVSVRLFPHLTRVESGQAATDAILEAGNAGQNLVI